MKMTQWFKSWEWAVLFLVIVVIVVYAKTVSISQWPLATGGVLCVAAVLLFGLLLDMKTLRVRKGILMVGLGVITSMVYKFGVAEYMKCALELTHAPGTCTDPVPPSVFIKANTIDTLVLLITIACGGVGGSILAAHGDVTATDAKSTAPAHPGDIQALLESIDSKLDRQNLKLNLVCGGAFLVLLLVIVRVFS
jgi:hypothetical protein